MFGPRKLPLVACPHIRGNANKGFLSDSNWVTVWGEVPSDRFIEH
jgi:hypothetical protein